MTDPAPQASEKVWPTAIPEDAPITDIPVGSTHFFLNKGDGGPYCMWPDENGVEIRHIPIAQFSKTVILERWGYCKDYVVRFLTRETNSFKVKSAHGKLFGIVPPVPPAIPTAGVKAGEGGLPLRPPPGSDIGSMLALNESLTALQEAKSERQFTLEQERNRSYQESQREMNRAALESQREGMMGLMQMQNMMMQQMAQMQQSTMTTVVTALTGGFRNQEVESLRAELAQMRQEPDEETDDEVIEEAFTRMATGDVMGGLKEIALKRGGKKVAQAWPMIEAKAAEIMTKIREAPTPSPAPPRNGAPREIVVQAGLPVGVK